MPLSQLPMASIRCAVGRWRKSIGKRPAWAVQLLLWHTKMGSTVRSTGGRQSGCPDAFLQDCPATLSADRSDRKTSGVASCGCACPARSGTARTQRQRTVVGRVGLRCVDSLMRPIQPHGFTVRHLAKQREDQHVLSHSAPLDPSAPKGSGTPNARDADQVRSRSKGQLPPILKSNCRRWGRSHRTHAARDIAPQITKHQRSRQERRRYIIRGKDIQQIRFGQHSRRDIARM